MKEKNKGIIELVEEALQQMEYISSAAKLRSPHGTMSYARTYQKQFSFVNNDTLKKNISYLLMLNDFLTWTVRRFFLAPGIKDMLLKNIITNFGYAVEATNKNIAKRISEKKDMGFDAFTSTSSQIQSLKIYSRTTYGTGC